MHNHQCQQYIKKHARQGAQALNYAASVCSCQIAIQSVYVFHVVNGQYNLKLI